MKKFLLSSLALCVWVCCQAQTNLVYTNVVPIEFYGLTFGLASGDAYSRASSFEEALRLTGCELLANQSSDIVFCNTSTNKHIFALLPSSFPRSVSAYLYLTLKTTNGISVTRTVQGKTYSPQPKPPLNLNVQTEGAYELPPLTDLFEFPSSGEYILEAHIWWWNRTNRELIFSDPVIIKVIKHPARMNTSETTNTPANKR